MGFSLSWLSRMFAKPGWAGQGQGPRRRPSREEPGFGQGDSLGLFVVVVSVHPVCAAMKGKRSTRENSQGGGIFASCIGANLILFHRKFRSLRTASIYEAHRVGRDSAKPRVR